eukprot:COSAG02_NODE_9939_length_2070_cov_1.429731_2_plen_33_part_00
MHTIDNVECHNCDREIIIAAGEIRLVREEKSP